VALLLGELFFELAGEFVDVGGFAESLNLLGCRFHVYAGVGLRTQNPEKT
jgi:hypothetical protein